VVLKSPEKEQKALTSNISRGGMAVRCKTSLKPGSTVQFEIGLPLAQPVKGRGEVAWSNTDGLMGIRFYMMGEEVKKGLWQWMEQRSAAGLA
jgi:c-di-GMP-binding flagellar brake protein YcgR